MEQRVVFIVRCHGEPNEAIEDHIMDLIADIVEMPEHGWGILTIGRQYFDDEGEIPCPHRRDSQVS